MNKDRKGYIQIYCGNGKGKTTAALGLSLRTLLSGGSVYFAQFCKGSETAEMGLCSIFENFVMEQYGTGKFIVSDPSEEDRKQARQGFEHCKNVLSSGFFDLVVLDIKMPGMNGIEALNEIKNINKNLPVILCSAYGEFKQDFSSWASDGYVVKSADTNELKQTIKNLLGVA